MSNFADENISPTALPLGSNTLFYPTHLLKFSFLTCATFGLYVFYWFFRCWQSIKRSEEASFSPLLRTYLTLFWPYPLSRRILGEQHKTLGIIIHLSILLLFLASELPEPYSLLSVFFFVPILPLVKRVNQLNSKEMPATYKRFGWKHKIVSIVGLPAFVVLHLITHGIIPSRPVISGNALSSQELNFLRQMGSLTKDESIIYYSAGIFSTENEGHFYTDKRVVSYGVDAATGKRIIETANYNEISNIETSYSITFLQNTEITITRNDGSAFLLKVYSRMGRDWTFASDLNSRWTSQRKTRAD